MNDSKTLIGMLMAPSGQSPIDAATMHAAAKRIEVLEATNELAYIPHRALVESRDALSKRFEKACGELTARETRIQELESDLEGVRLINKLQAEAIAEERANNRAWLTANAPGGWIDNLRKEARP